MKKDDLNKEDSFELLRHIQKKPETNQRQLARDLGFSLGKLNYLLNALKDKGFVKLKNFSGNPKKIQYLYILTPKGISQKTRLTINFMKRKMREYDDLKKDLNN
tara:strand:- start:74 stop:385 length:312 start_codon:yes stop_codon:yes gene_type:complete